MNFLFKINGEPIFWRGVNWVPLSPFACENEKRLNERIEALESELSSRQIILEESGSIANAALSINKVFEDHDACRFRLIKQKDEMENIPHYGIDILEDNVADCQQIMLDIFKEEYKTALKQDCSKECEATVRFILKKNIIWGDALTLKRIDNPNEPIVFSQWSPVNGKMMKRQDFNSKK